MTDSFSNLSLAEPLARAVAEMGYESMTPIQAQAIPVVLTGKDVMGAAQTGTGKTAAFSLPLLQRLLKQCSAALYNFLMELLLALAALLVLLQSKYECFICYKQKGSRHRGVTGPTSHHPGTRP